MWLRDLAFFFYFAFQCEKLKFQNQLSLYCVQFTWTPVKYTNFYSYSFLFKTYSSFEILSAAISRLKNNFTIAIVCSCLLGCVVSHLYWLCFLLIKGNIFYFFITIIYDFMQDIVNIYNIYNVCVYVCIAILMIDVCVYIYKEKKEAGSWTLTFTPRIIHKLNLFLCPVVDRFLFWATFVADFIVIHCWLHQWTTGQSFGGQG